ncbi:hypothetical protein AB0I72_00395 [Nocardiopsis sp. NPDC049922]|uniref:hypothetical protein n=1 Tax=Nocardiopsis sp. NPDC049922 TaxID=3155157 RepID=UPI0033FACBF1
MTSEETCPEIGLDPSGFVRRCVLAPGHEDRHEDAKGRRWEPPEVSLPRLRDRWGHAYWIAWTGRMWVATAHDRCAPWRTEVEPTVEQLETRLHRHTRPRVPAATRDR